jgi:prepilin-type N-terminal cleavage/methylation domain-containing protein
MIMRASRRHRRGFSLLEVMIALAILTVSLIILAETQSSAVVLTNEAERTVTASDLARYKMSEVLLMIEQDGFQMSDQSEFGDFAEFGEDAMNLEFGEELEDYHWEWLVSEVDIDTLGDLAQAADDISDQGDANAVGADANGSALDALGMLGIGPDMIAQFLGPYIREVRVRVWWGEDSEQAEEDGTEVVLTTHVINPTGALSLEQALPQ